MRGVAIVEILGTRKKPWDSQRNTRAFRGKNKTYINVYSITPLELPEVIKPKGVGCDTSHLTENATLHPFAGQASRICHAMALLS